MIVCGILMIILFILVSRYLYNYIHKNLERFDLYKKIHEYYKQTMELRDPYCIINNFR